MPVMTTADALAHGITPTQLRSRRFRHLMRGIVIPSDEPVTMRTWVAAARLVLGPGAVAIGRTALQLCGLDIGDTLPVKFATPQRVRTRIPQISVVWRSGLDARNPVQLTKDAVIYEAATLPLKDAVTLCDRVLYCKLATASSMRRWCDDASGRAAKALALARPGAESIPETHVRLCIAFSGCPEPTPQVTINDARGFIGRFDLGLTEYGVLIDYEGDHHRVDKRQWNKDLNRGQRIQMLGMRLVRIGSDFFRNPWEAVEIVHSQLRLGGYRGPAPRPTKRWIASFGV